MTRLESEVSAVGVRSASSISAPGNDPTAIWQAGVPQKCALLDPFDGGGKMNRREAFLLIQACNSMETYLIRGLDATRESLDVFVPEVGQGVEAFSYLAVSAASIVAGGFASISPPQVIDKLEVCEIDLLPGMGMDWDAGIEMIRVVAEGATYDEIAAAGSRMDVPTAINSSFSVAYSAVACLAASSGKPATEWVDIMRSGALREA